MNSSFKQPLSQLDLNSTKSSALLQDCSKNLNHDLGLEQQKFEKEILAGRSLTDPIDPWHRYLEWSKKQIKNGLESFYEKLLQKYLAEFLNYKQYKNDPRYVNAWLDTAQASEKSDAIFAYMRSNDIGTKCASFYVAWADKYEKDGEYNSARALYDLGIKHHAEPYETISIIKTLTEEKLSSITTSTENKGIDEMLLEEESFPFAESEAHRKIRESYGESLQKMRVTYSMNKIYSPNGEFQLEEIMAAKWRQKNGIIKQQQSKHEESMEFESLKKENQRIEAKLAIKRNQVSQLLQMWNSKMGIEDDIHDDDQTINLQKLMQKFRVQNKTHEQNDTVKSSASNIPEAEDFSVHEKSLVSNHAQCSTSLTGESVVERSSQIQSDVPQLHSTSCTEEAYESKVIGNDNSSRNLSYQAQSFALSAKESFNEGSSRHLSDLAQPSPTLCTKEAFGDLFEAEHPDAGHSNRNFDSESSKSLHNAIFSRPFLYDGFGDIMTMFNKPLPAFTSNLTGDRSSLFHKSAEKSSDFEDLLSKNEDFAIFCDDQPQQNYAKSQKESFTIFSDVPPGEKVEIFSENQSAKTPEYPEVFDEKQPFQMFPDGQQQERKFELRKENEVKIFDENCPDVFEKQDEFQIFCDNLPERNTENNQAPQKENFEIFKDKTTNAFEIFKEKEPKENIVIFNENSSFQVFDENKRNLPDFFVDKSGACHSYNFSTQRHFITKKKSPSKTCFSETIVASEIQSDNLNDRDLLGMTAMAEGFLAESTSHESLFNKNKLNKSQENGENNHLSPILEASNEMSVISHPNCESLYPNKATLASDASIPCPHSITFNTGITSGTTLQVNNVTHDTALKLPQLSIIDDPWQKIHQTSVEWNQNIPFVDQSSPLFKKNSQFQFGSQLYTVEDLIGKGGFAKVHRATTQNGKIFAIKIEQPRCEWEIALIDLAKERLSNHPLANQIFIDIMFSVVFKDTSVILTEYVQHGTLLDFVNYVSSQMVKVTPLQYHRLTMRLLCLVDALHSVDIIHGDVKPDNFLIYSDYKSCSTLKSVPQVRLIDFGRSIDMQAFPPNTAFMASCGTSAFVCTQMKLKRPWNYHIDYYGLAGTIYLLLCNQYMKVQQQLSGDWKPQNRLPRWTDSLWSNMLSTLLNYPDPADGQICGYQASPLPQLIKTMKEAISKVES